MRWPPVFSALNRLRTPWVHWARDWWHRSRRALVLAAPWQVGELGLEFGRCAGVWPLALVSTGSSPSFLPTHWPVSPIPRRYPRSQHRVRWEAGLTTDPLVREAGGLGSPEGSGVGGFPRPYGLGPPDDSRPRGHLLTLSLAGVPCLYLYLLFPRAFHTLLVHRPLYPHLSCVHRWGALSWHFFSQCHSRLTRPCNELHTPASSRRRVKNRLASPAPGDTCTSSSPQQHCFLNQEREQLWVGAGESLRVLSPAWPAP